MLEEAVSRQGTNILPCNVVVEAGRRVMNRYWQVLWW